MKKMLFIINPCSGKEQIRRGLLDILNTFTGAAYDIRVHVTQGPGDAAQAARALGDGMDLVVCSGGDGTLNETVSGIMELERRPLLGYIPAGSTNDFAASLRIDRRPEQAARDLVKGVQRAIDVGRFCGERYFMYIAAFGAFTEISYATPQDRKNLLGHQAYMLEGVKSFSSIRPYHMRIAWEDQTLEDDFVFGMVTNTVSVGGFKGLVNQSVALDDGRFEVLLVRMPRTPVDLGNIISYLFLKEEPNEYVYRFKTDSLRVISQTRVDWVLDGEFGGARQEVEIGNLRKQIKLLLPAAERLQKM